MKIHQIIFSPTGGTQRVSEFLCQDMGKESVVTDLCVKAADTQLPNIQEDDLAIIAMPVFAGRVPALAVERLRMVKPNSAKCVVVAVFGNRAYDDALLEIQDVASEISFRDIAAVAAVAEEAKRTQPAIKQSLLTAYHFQKERYLRVVPSEVCPIISFVNIHSQYVNATLYDAYRRKFCDKNTETMSNLQRNL